MINSFELFMIFVNNILLKIPVLLVAIYLCFMLFRQKQLPGIFYMFIGVLLFALGEAACGVNTWVVIDLIPSMEIIHQLGMALGFGFIFIGSYFVIDENILFHSSDEKSCLLLRFCKASACPKIKTDLRCTTLRCRGHYFFFVSICALIILAFLPLTAQDFPNYLRINPEKYENIHIAWIDSFTQMFIAPNAKHVTYELLHKFDFTRYPYLFTLEKYVYPIFAMLCFMISFIVMIFKKNHPEKIIIYPLCIGVGLLSFSLMRIVLFSSYESTIQAFWEESTELATLLAMIILLKIYIFKKEPGV